MAKKLKTQSIDPSRMAQAIFAAAEAVGIADRQLLEELTAQVVRRLGGAPVLPGMEGLVGAPASQPSPQQVQQVLREIMAEQTARPTTPVGAIPLTPNARRVLERRYLRKDVQGKVAETPEELFRRVARNIAQAEALYNPQADLSHRESEFYRLMTSLEFLPNSPTLMNAGRELQQLSACFVLPVEDSMESIFDAVKYTAIIHKSGGGTGFSFSRLRPEGDFVGSTSGVASGPVSFMKAFDVTTDVTKQGGTRRGANMGILSIHHPDILKFIEAKADPRAFTNFNLSVAVSDAFVKALEASAEYDLINPRTGEVSNRLPARQVWDKIVEMSWRTGDPGLVFIDRINEANPTPHRGSIEATNPCGEQPLLPYESCNLGSINLVMMLHHPSGNGTGRPEVDWARLERTVRLAVRFLDNVIDMNRFPLSQIAEQTKMNRKVGLGVMGFADVLLQMGIPYDSEEALKLAAEMMGFISSKADEASAALAEERGPFPSFKGSIYDRPGAPRLRNATRTTIAPTGTLSIIAGCSSGIEPLFALYFVRNILDNEHLVELNPYFEEVARREGFHSQELLEALAAGKSLKEIAGVPDWVKRVFVTAHDITPEWHVWMQKAFQRFTDNAVSKTVNLPHHATTEEVDRIYRMAYREGLKGITIFRDRSRETQVLSVPGAVKEEAKPPAEEGRAEAAAGRRTPRPRPERLQGTTSKVTTGCGNMYVNVTADEQGIAEVFTSLGKAGGCASAQLEAVSRLISLALRSGVDSAAIVKQLKGIRCPTVAWDKGKAILSCADAIARVVEQELGLAPEPVAKGETQPALAAAPISPGGNIAGLCPDCSSPLIYQEGCFLCHACGYTKCA